jgi:hypothetical protein
MGKMQGIRIMAASAGRLTMLNYSTVMIFSTTLARNLMINLRRPGCLMGTEAALEARASQGSNVRPLHPIAVHVDQWRPAWPTLSEKANGCCKKIPIAPFVAPGSTMRHGRKNVAPAAKPAI